MDFSSLPPLLSLEKHACSFSQLIEREKGGKKFSPPLDEVTIRPFPLGVEQEDGEGRGRVALARGEGGEFGREVECL